MKANLLLLLDQVDRYHLLNHQMMRITMTFVLRNQWESLSKLRKTNGTSLVHFASKILQIILRSLQTNLSSSDKAHIISTLLDSQVLTARLQEQARRSIISYMRDNSKTMFTTDSDDSFTQTETTTLVIGWKAKDQVLENQQTRVEEFMKDSGNIASSSEKREGARSSKHEATCSCTEIYQKNKEIKNLIDFT